VPGVSQICPELGGEGEGKKKREKKDSTCPCFRTYSTLLPSGIAVSTFQCEATGEEIRRGTPRFFSGFSDMPCHLTCGRRKKGEKRNAGPLPFPLWGGTLNGPRMNRKRGSAYNSLGLTPDGIGKREKKKKKGKGTEKVLGRRRDGAMIKHGKRGGRREGGRRKNARN